MEEIWVDLPGYEGVYAINNLGIVKRLQHSVSPFGVHKNVILKEKIVKQHLSPRKYMFVRLSNSTGCRTKMVHRLVAEAFIPNPLNKPEVNHLDGNKLNNNLSNLEWSTSGENQKHAWDTGLRKRFTQEKHPKSRKIKDIISGKVYNSIKELSYELDMKQSTLRKKLNKGAFQNFIKL